ncbi:MAG: Multidrug resistance protein MdtK [Firmicutes bacterium ADurb.Bin182]|nr:MAG: Multidrug resistance protein MdtK [Firmicutes bacterium ADurb.Bin182]
MIGGLGELQLAGVGAANQITMLLDICMFGVMSAAGVFMAQHWGRKEIAGFRSAMGLSVMTGSVITALFFIGTQIFPSELISLFSKDPAVIGYGVKYIRLASFGYILRIIVFVYGTALKSCAKPLLPMISGAAALFVNAFLNYCLIFGNFGFPALGIDGAAIATLTGSALDAFVLLIFSYTMRMPSAAKPAELMNQSRQGFIRFLGVFVPVFLNDMIWALGISLQNLLIAQMGTDSFAAMMIVNTVDRLAFVLLIGIGTACAVMIGHTVGAGEPEKAMLYSKRFLFLSASAGAVLGALVLSAGIFIPELYNVSESVRLLAKDTIFVLGFAMVTYGINFTIIIGILRSGGDARAAAIIDIVPLWLLSLPAVAVTGLILRLPLPVVYLSMIPSNIVRLVWGLHRARSGGWMHSLSL